MEKWGALGAFLEEVGVKGMEAIKHMESRWVLVPTHLRELRMMVTPQSRRDILAHMTDKCILKASLDDAMQRVAKDMWVDFVWSSDNPEISADVRVFLSLLSLTHSLPVLCGTWCGILALALPSHTPLFEFMTLKRHQSKIVVP